MDLSYNPEMPWWGGYNNCISSEENDFKEWCKQYLTSSNSFRQLCLRWYCKEFSNIFNYKIIHMQTLSAESFRRLFSGERTVSWGTKCTLELSGWFFFGLCSLNTLVANRIEASQGCYRNIISFSHPGNQYFRHSNEFSVTIHTVELKTVKFPHLYYVHHRWLQKNSLLNGLNPCGQYWFLYV